MLRHTIAFDPDFVLSYVEIIALTCLEPQTPLARPVHLGPTLQW